MKKTVPEIWFKMAERLGQIFVGFVNLIVEGVDLTELYTIYLIQ